MTYRIVHYINQFFAGIGGEEKADIAPESRAGVVGPECGCKLALGAEAEVVGTVICGDGYYAENMDSATDTIIKMISDFKPDAVVAGPAFNAGRYGTACGGVSDAVSKNSAFLLLQACTLRTPALTCSAKASTLYRQRTAHAALKMPQGFRVFLL